MRALPPFSAVVNTQQAINSIDDSVTGLEIQNESNFSLQISGPASKWIPAWVTDFIDLSNTQNPSAITITPYAVLSSAATPPSANFLVTAYNRNDAITGTYPYSMSRMVTASAVTQSALNLLAPDELQGVYLDDTSFTSPPILVVIPTQEPVPTGALDVALAYRVSSSLVQLMFKSIASSNLMQMMMPFKFEAIGGSVIKGMQIVSGNGPGTFSHALGVTPTAVILCPQQSAEAFFVGGYTSTQFTVGGITSTHAWVALVFV